MHYQLSQTNDSACPNTFSFRGRGNLHILQINSRSNVVGILTTRFHAHVTRGSLGSTRSTFSHIRSLRPSATTADFQATKINKDNVSSRFQLIEETIVEYIIELTKRDS